VKCEIEGIDKRALFEDIRYVDYNFAFEYFETILSMFEEAGSMRGLKEAREILEKS